MITFLVIQDQQVIDTVFYSGHTAVEVKESLIGRGEFPANIHVLEDSIITRDLAEMDNNDPQFVTNNEAAYLLAIETGFMDEDTLETFEDYLN
tara:strand:+ start:22715 stop:22993 length:279 start_codon:yes stop_codon:yes gene_type:complete